MNNLSEIEKLRHCDPKPKRWDRTFDHCQNKVNLCT